MLSQCRPTGSQTGNSLMELRYDSFGRVTQRETHCGEAEVMSEAYTYHNPMPDTTSAQVSGLAIYAGNYASNLSYTYDDNGNILSITDGTNTTSYVYDSANQLIRENNPIGNFTYTWEYDNAGNIQCRKEYAYTTGSLENITPTHTIAYTYGDENWGDLLTAYNGQTITYDQIGNPLSDGTWTYNWQNGRQLASMSNGTTTWTYTYDGSGLRTKRTDGTNTYTYTYIDGQLWQFTVNGQVFSITYDVTGSPWTLQTGDALYFYVTNLQGDVVALVDRFGNVAAVYTYDAWGNPLSVTGTLASTVGVWNPLRYRGYVYDTEAGLYYLQSRYYNPEIGRFLNADAFTSTGQGFLGNNMFAYCGNNPIVRYDPCGTSFLRTLKEKVSKIYDTFNETISAIKKFKAKISQYLTIIKRYRGSFNEEEKVLIATIASEATVTVNGDPVSTNARQAMANVALNRVGSREWSHLKSVSEVCAHSLFDGYNSNNYHACMAYLDNRDFSNATYEAIIWAVAKAYTYDITNGCQLYYTPAAMSNPGSAPVDWIFSLLTEVIIPGVDPYSEGRFYKYS